jgi:oxygen-independent coproporphyrinogen-3 oxidase
MSLGLYISVPFCRTKCTYCNFASDVFSRAAFQRYVDRLCSDIEHATETAQQMGGQFERVVDTIYLGGGTPTILDIAHLERMFVTISQNFTVAPGAEITVECAPGTITPGTLESFKRCGVNRVSLGVQSFVDEEARSVARLHTRDTVMSDLAHLRNAGITNINVDLIAGLPYQTVESWEYSVGEAMGCGIPHVSVYLLEVDDDSRLGRELIAGGTKYHAHFVPDEDLTADFYTVACERLNAVGIQQYEISNFAREGLESRHNLKYWTRQPYLGFGVDAHSMLLGDQDRSGLNAIRFASADSLDAYLVNAPLNRTPVSNKEAVEEAFFLGLRLNEGVNLRRVAEQFGEDSIVALSSSIAELVHAELLKKTDDRIRLTTRGRLLSNDVFQRFIELADESGVTLTGPAAVL